VYQGISAKSTESTIQSAKLRRRFTLRSRASLHLEILALRHKLTVVTRAPPTPPLDVDKPNAVGVTVAAMARLAVGPLHRQAVNRHRLAIAAAFAGSGRGKADTAQGAGIDSLFADVATPSRGRSPRRFARRRAHRAERLRGTRHRLEPTRVLGHLIVMNAAELHRVLPDYVASYMR
jgi:hypothetical protein